MKEKKKKKPESRNNSYAFFFVMKKNSKKLRRLTVTNPPRGTHTLQRGTRWGGGQSRLNGFHAIRPSLRPSVWSSWNQVSWAAEAARR